MSKKLIWVRGYEYAVRLAAENPGNRYGIRECRIIAMAYEKGWKDAKRMTP